MTGGRRAVLAAAALALAATACSRGSEPEVTPPTATATSAPALDGNGWGAPVLLGTIADPEVTESSGLAASRRHPGRYWTHNDSDDDPLLYCLGGHGESCGTWHVPGADARDWEDIAAGPGPEPSTPYLYIGDIGDNVEDQPAVVVYRVAEPDVGNPTGVTAAAEPVTLRYPDGSHNAEALLVHPQSGDLYVVVKEVNPRVYVARAPISSSSTTTMELVATLSLAVGGPAVVTGGDIAPDGRRLALSTYGPGYELRLRAEGLPFDDIWAQPPQTVALGTRVQGEAIAFRLDGRALLTTSERGTGPPSPLYQVEAA
ncbi:MAG: hypothetical protein M3144_05285 [Actinomycetota bacterium]|nr:hypothetical protein [Actinomycetota bacterium]